LDFSLCFKIPMNGCFHTTLSSLFLCCVMVTAVKGYVWWKWGYLIFLDSRVSLGCKLLMLLSKLLYNCWTQQLFFITPQSGTGGWCRWPFNVPCFIWWSWSSLFGINPLSHTRSQCTSSSLSSPHTFSQCTHSTLITVTLHYFYDAASSHKD
jgi:hypothetical protein